MRYILNKKYNLVLSLLFIVYLFGYFSISKNTIPIMCVIQIFLLDIIFKSQSRIIQINPLPKKQEVKTPLFHYIYKQIDEIINIYFMI